jgi:hypothetical protein
VVVHDLDLVGISVPPYETDAVLVVNANAVLALAIAFQGFRSQPWQLQIAKGSCGVQKRQTDASCLLDCLKSPAELPVQEPVDFLVAAGPDHTNSILRHLYNSGNHMPGSVQNAAPAAVLPHSLCRAFVHTREYPVIDNEYRNGESQRSVETTTSRKRWWLAKRLTPAQLQGLRAFYEARNGPAEPFYFYDPYETNPKFSYDSTGLATQGRYTVRFNCEWSQSASPGRVDVEIELVEVA